MENFNQILKSVNQIFCDVLDNKKIVLIPQTTANDIEEWDSLAHIQLIVAIEKTLNIKFTTAEIQQWQNIGDMCTLINNKLNN